MIADVPTFRPPAIPRPESVTVQGVELDPTRCAACGRDPIFLAVADDPVAAAFLCDHHAPWVRWSQWGYCRLE